MNLVLLAEDEPVSRRFLAEALETLGCRCEQVEDGNAAAGLAIERPYDLLLLDVNLPGLDGASVLRRVRDDASAASREAPALALTADPSPALHRELLRAGFGVVGTKPLSLAQLAALLQQALAETRIRDRALPVWDDAAALRASGSPEIIRALRGLLLKDLPAQRARIAAAVAGARPVEAMSELHRLRAACGFCGAAALDAAVQTLAGTIERGLDTTTALQEFLQQAHALETRAGRS